MSEEMKVPVGWEITTIGKSTINFDGKRIPLSRVVRSSRKGKYRYFGATEIVDYIDDYIFDGKFLLLGEDGANLVSKSKPLSFILTGSDIMSKHHLKN